MPRIAVLSDIHGNLPALEAALDDLRAKQVDEVLLGGDLVGRGPQGSAVVARLRQEGWPGVRGNHEDYLLTFRRGDVPRSWLHDDEWAASRWMAAELADEDARYLDRLPLAMSSRLVPELCLVHGSPRSHSEGLGPWTTDEQLARHLGRIPGSVIVCGHTHRPMCRRLPAGLVVNVGAVGLPFNRDRSAQYAILSFENGEWGVDLRRVPYPVEATLEVYERSGFRAEGGVTAELLRLELLHAAPFLVPFLQWAEVRRRPTETSQIDAFRNEYDPDRPIREFLMGLTEER